MRQSDLYSFDVGRFRCIAVSDGDHTYGPPAFPPPPTLLFANAPQEPLTEALAGHGLDADRWQAMTTPYTCLLVDTGQHLVLVDTGAGDLAPTTGRLVRNLERAGIAPGDIDLVLLTHAHPDHVGGNTDAQGRPAYPHARHIMCRQEWDFWMAGQAAATLGEHGQDLIEFAQTSLSPIQGQLELVERGAEIVLGIRALDAQGHTPGHMAVGIASGGEELLCISDLVLHPIHLEQPTWHSTMVDVDPEQLASTRRRLLGQAWQWQPLSTARQRPEAGS